MCAHGVHMAKKRKVYGNPLVRARIPRPMYQKLRALAKVYRAPLPVFFRDLLATLFNVQLGQEFQARLQQGMLKYEQRELPLGDGVFSAPRSEVLAARRVSEDRLTKGGG